MSYRPWYLDHRIYIITSIYNSIYKDNIDINKIKFIDGECNYIIFNKWIKEIMKDEQLIDDLKKLLGLPPYDKPNNICWNDAYYALSLEKKYGKPIKELLEQAGLK